MKRSLLLLACLLAGLTAARAQQPALPAEISGFYEARNFVAAFSTPGERLQIARLASPGAVRDATGSARLADVYVRLREVAARTIALDPGITRLRGGPAASDFVAPSLVRVRGVRRDGPDRLIVEVTAYDLDAGTNRRLIARFEEGARTPATGGVTLHAYPERHRWVRIGGRWRKQPDAVRSGAGD